MNYINTILFNKIPGIALSLYLAMMLFFSKVLTEKPQGIIVVEFSICIIISSSKPNKC